MPTWTKDVTAAAPVYQSEGQELAVAWNRVALATADLTLNNVIPLVRLPRGAIVHDVFIRVTDMDSATSGIVSVGVTGDTERYIRRVSIQVAGAFRAANDATAVGTMIAAGAFTAESTVNLLIQTAPGTALAGTIDIAVYYTCE
jgi:hypothetical protein